MALAKAEEEKVVIATVIIMARILSLHNRTAINPEVVIILFPRFQEDKIQRIILQVTRIMQAVANKDNSGRQLTRDETRKKHYKMKYPNLRIEVEILAAVIGTTTIQTTLTTWEPIMLMEITVILIFLIMAVIAIATATTLVG